MEYPIIPQELFAKLPELQPGGRVEVLVDGVQWVAYLSEEGHMTFSCMPRGQVRYITIDLKIG